MIHITSKYITEVKSGKPQGEAIRSTLRSIGLATFLTSATTAIGFCSLFTSKVIPIRIFGLAAAAGIMITFLVVILLTLALFTYIPPQKLKNLDFGDSFFNEQLKKLYHFTKRRGKFITLWLSWFSCPLLLGDFQDKYRLGHRQRTTSRRKNDGRFYLLRGSIIVVFGPMKSCLKPKENIPWMIMKSSS